MNCTCTFWGCLVVVLSSLAMSFEASVGLISVWQFNFSVTISWKISILHSQTLFSQLSQAVHSSKADRLNKHFFWSPLLWLEDWITNTEEVTYTQLHRLVKRTEKWPKINILVWWTYKRYPSQFVNKIPSTPKLEEKKIMCEVRRTFEVQAD